MRAETARTFLNPALAAAVFRAHHFFPVAVFGLDAGRKGPAVRVDEGYSILISGGPAGIFEVGAFTIEGKRLPVVLYNAVIDPHMRHHGADPRTEITLCLGIVAERHQSLAGA